MTSTNSIIAAVAVLAVLAFSLRGCGRYNEVNQLTYEHAKALYAACNSKQPQRLKACAEMIAEAESAEGISSTENDYLQSIIKKAQAGNWQGAQAMARQLMVDQTDF